MRRVQDNVVNAAARMAENVGIDIEIESKISVMVPA